jgi:xylulose-5-phosphate/fructose-6-phosphate phosphoketolase
VIFAYHGYPWTIHRLTYRRKNHDNIHVRGYNEEGTTTTPFDMTVLNGLDRYHIVHSVLDWVPELKSIRIGLKQVMDSKLLEHRAYIGAHGQDMPEIRDWHWIEERASRIG